MTRKKFEELKVVDDRIFHLKMIKDYFDKTFKGKSFRVEIKLTALGETSETVDFVDNKCFPVAVDDEDEDIKYVTDMIQKRIEDLENQFS